MKYKVGDKVRIKSLDWYNENKNICNEIIFKNNSHWRFVADQSNYCGQIATITAVSKTAYHLESIPWNWTDEMIEGLVEEDIIDIDKFQDDNEMIDIIDECVNRLKANECQINLPEGYIFKDENGNVINAQKIVLEKKKKEYPKTYDECCKVLNIEDNSLLINTKHITDYERDLGNLMGQLHKLIICRYAYWKLYGEEMRLGKSWEPDYKNENQRKYCIYNRQGDIRKGVLYSANAIFVFPTAEIRDYFKENFDKDLEICKELL